MRSSKMICFAIAALSVPFAAQAADQKSKPQAKAPAAAPAAGQPAQEDVKRGVIIIRSFNAALDSDKVDRERKGQYIACLYNNSVKNISIAAGKIIADNPKMDANNPDHVFVAASAACKALPTGANASAPAAPSSGKQPEGR